MLMFMVRNTSLAPKSEPSPVVWTQAGVARETLGGLLTLGGTLVALGVRLVMWGTILLVALRGVRTGFLLLGGKRLLQTRPIQA